MDKETFLSFYEKAGYKVIDSFTYNDIKLFLIRNRPKTVYRIIYIALLLLLLFCVGFLIGRLWHEASSAGLFFEQIGQCAIFTLLGCAAIIPIHEFVHWLAYKNEGAADVRFGAIWRSFAFYAAAHNFVADYYAFRRIALAPFLILLGLLFLLLLFPLPLWAQIATLAILLFHLISCAGDLMMLSYMNRNKKRGVVTVDDVDNRWSYFMKK